MKSFLLKSCQIYVQAKVAIKLVTRGVSNAKAAEREIANLRLCGLHPYIIHMREVDLYNPKGVYSNNYKIN